MIGPRKKAGRVHSGSKTAGTSAGCSVVRPKSNSSARMIQALLACPRILKIYPADHQRVQTQFEEVLQRYKALFRERSEPVVLSVRGMRIEIDGVELAAPPEMTASMALMLRRRRIQSLTFRPGIERAELEKLVRVLGTDHRELHRKGGAEALLGSEASPHLGLAVCATGEEGEDGTGLPAVLERLLAAPETAETLDRLRHTFGNPNMAGGTDEFDQQVWHFLSKAEWAEMKPGQAADAFRTFLKMLEHLAEQARAQEDNSMHTRLESLKSFFREADPEELVHGDPAESKDAAGQENPDAAESRVAYSVEDVREQFPDHLEAARVSPDAIRGELATHNHEENALLILCELMVGAETSSEYLHRRDCFLGAFADRRYSSDSVARILRYIAVDLPPMAFESRDNLVEAVFDSTSDEEALVLFLCSMTSQPDVARPILTRVITRHDPFPLLVRLLTAPLLNSFRLVLTDQLLTAARTKREAFVIWARKHRDLLFAPEIFEPLFSKGTEFLGPVCKEILSEGPARDRTFLINILEEAGSETALRLLVLGMPGSEEPCDPLILHALASFRHPLALSVLREVIHRNNTRGMDLEETATALGALSRMELPESASFLGEVAGSRRMMLPLYRAPLRRLAKDALEGRR